MVRAYSRLKTVLKQRDLSLGDLQQFLRTSGVRVGQRSFECLEDETQPLERLDLRLAGVICQVCEVPLSELIVFRPSEDEVRRLSLVKQKRLTYLMDGNNNGALTEAESEELRRLARECEEMTVHNARFLAGRRHQTPA